MKSVTPRDLQTPSPPKGIPVWSFLSPSWTVGRPTEKSWGLTTRGRLDGSREGLKVTCKTFLDSGQDGFEWCFDHGTAGDDGSCGVTSGRPSPPQRCDKTLKEGLRAGGALLWECEGWTGS